MNTSSEPDRNITLVLRRAENGDASAAAQILPMVYDELRKLAAARLAREAAAHTFQPTALVHEAWLRLGGDRQPAWRNRAQFFAAAAEAMRRILIDNARRKRAVRHGGKVERVSGSETGHELAAPAKEEELVAIHEALDRLAAHDARKAQVVKLRYFVGLTTQQIAEVLGLAEPTVKRDWAYARAWLFKLISAERVGRKREPE